MRREANAWDRQNGGEQTGKAKRMGRKRNKASTKRRGVGDSSFSRGTGARLYFGDAGRKFGPISWSENATFLRKQRGPRPLAASLPVPSDSSLAWRARDIFSDLPPPRMYENYIMQRLTLLADVVSTVLCDKVQFKYPKSFFLQK